MLGLRVNGLGSGAEGHTSHIQHFRGPSYLTCLEYVGACFKMPVLKGGEATF